MDYITLNPVESADHIMKTAKDVKVDVPECNKVALMILDTVVDGSIDAIDYTANPLHPSGLTDEEKLNWVFLLDVLNFSFWPDEGQKYEVTFQDKKETGYLALCAAFRRAHKAGVPFHNSELMVTITPEVLATALRSDSGDPIPLFEERLHAVRTAGCWLHGRYKGQFMNVVKQCGASAQTLLRTILTCESFRDMTIYNKKRVSFLKRAQILVSDVHGALKNGPNADLVAFPDLETISMFADYRVPQALCYLNCLEYSDALLEVLQTNTMLKYGEEKECELRGASIYAVQKIYEEIKRVRAAGPYKDVDLTEKRAVLPVDIDVWLWQFRRDNAEDVEALVPHHRTRSIYY